MIRIESAPLFGREEYLDNNRAAAEAEARRKEDLARQDFWANKNIELQREFAKSGLQWKVEDAKKVGIHPLAAIGASGTSFSPVSVGHVPYEGPSRMSRGDAMSDLGGIVNMGQNISRAVKATMSIFDRQQLEMNELEMEGARLRNKVLESQLFGGSSGYGRGNQAPPGMPIEGRTQPDVTFHNTMGGGIAPSPSESFADRAEDQLIPQVGWAMRNMVVPAYPKEKPKGWPKTRWYYNPAQAEWVEGNNKTVPYWLQFYDFWRRKMRGQ